jgi:hypothetical protein
VLPSLCEVDLSRNAVPPSASSTLRGVCSARPLLEILGLLES